MAPGASKTRGVGFLRRKRCGQGNPWQDAAALDVKGESDAGERTDLTIGR
jgi:hypothetical protein